MLFLLPLFLICCWSICAAQDKGWTRLAGGYSWGGGRKLAVDSLGNIYVTGESVGDFDGQACAGSYDVLLTKYYSDGTRAWTKLSGTPSWDDGRYISIDSSDNVYITGYTEGGLDGEAYAGGGDMYVMKYNADGSKAWTRVVGSSSYDVGCAVSPDNKGSVYAVGYSTLMWDGSQYTSGDILLKYSTDGIKLWTRFYATRSYSTGWGYIGRGLSVDSEGSAYVAGYSYESVNGQPHAGSDDIFLIKYNSNGSSAWTRMAGTSSSDCGVDVKVDLFDNVYVTGFTFGALDGQAINNPYDLFLIKYTSDGAKLWTRLSGSTAPLAAAALAVDTSGDAYLTGSAEGETDGQYFAGLQDIFIMKFYDNGTKAWTRLSGSYSYNVGQGIGVDKWGNVFSTGYTFGTFDGQYFAGAYDMFIVQYHNDIRYIGAATTAPTQHNVEKVIKPMNRCNA